MLSRTAASLLAGSIGGAIGVGVAFPLDTLKTKSQVFGRQGQRKKEEKEGRGKDNHNGDVEMCDGRSSPCTVASTDNDPLISDAYKATALGTFQLIKLIFQKEGIGGFYGGVRLMMIGQAFIKAIAFSANSFALSYLQRRYGVSPASFVTLVSAAMFAGFVASFAVAPVERIKVLMQAKGSGGGDDGDKGEAANYQNDIECIQTVLSKEGLEGLLLRGLGPTLAREVPSYAIYFVVYESLIQTATARWLGHLAPLVLGATSGCACWIPVYPVDVVKTLVQNTEGDDKGASSWDVAKKLYFEGGIGAFFDGLTPKMLRAAVNHAVTFFVYDIVMQLLT